MMKMKELRDDILCDFRRIVEEELRGWLILVSVILLGLSLVVFGMIALFSIGEGDQEVKGRCTCEQGEEAALSVVGGDIPAAGYASLEVMEANGVVYTSDIYRDDVDLGADEQELLWMACESSGVPYDLMLALVWRETNYRNIVGDNGASEGYCQVQRRWHGARMERLGVTDLMEPSGNFQVACDYMADLLAKYSTEDALTVYNSGSPGKSAYATAVLDKMVQLERG